MERARAGRPALAWSDYRREVAAAATDPRIDRLVLAGADGLEGQELLRRVAYARDPGGFRHLGVQTNGLRFADVDLARAARAAGVDEFSVSVTAPTAEVEAEITGRAEDFAHLLAALRNVHDTGARLIACTPVIEPNARHLAGIAELVLQFQPARVEFHNFVPVGVDDLELVAPLAAVEPALRDALDRLATSATMATATRFPRCILGPHDEAFVPDPPAPGMAFHCFYGRACAWSGPCQGLPEPYIDRFGWEVERLRPREDAPRHAASSAGTAPPVAVSADRPEASRWRELLSAPDGQPLERTALWSLEDVSQRGRQVRFRFLLPNGGRYELVLEPRDDAVRRHAQTAGFNVALVPVGSSPRGPINRLLFTLLPIVSRNDDGRLRLD